MGRTSTGVCSVKECVRIELKNILKWGYFDTKGATKTGSLSWTSGATIAVSSFWEGDNRFFKRIIPKYSNHP